MTRLVDKATGWQKTEFYDKGVILTLGGLLASPFFGFPKTYFADYKNVQIRCHKISPFMFFDRYFISCNCEDENIVDYSGKEAKTNYETAKTKFEQERTEKIVESIKAAKDSIK